MTPHHLPALMLVVEDDAGDQVLIQDTLEASPIPKHVRVVSDGEEAMEYLFRYGRYPSAAAAPRPDLILLDLNMPRLDGREVAARLKADCGLRSIPIVTFTTSAREEDVASCYVLGINSYVQKPTDYDRFQAVLLDIAHYWLTVSLKPPPPQ